VYTPLIRCQFLERLLGGGTEVYAKLEFLQATGTFKARGALATISDLDSSQLSRGVTAVSAGNHAIATAYAARQFGTTAKVVMPKYASTARLDACRHLGAEVVLADDVHGAFAMAEGIRDVEQRYLVHPFEGPFIATGTGTLGLEICDQLEQFDAVVVPIGGGGLCAGIASAVKQVRPDCQVYGVEPMGAASMYRSLSAKAPVRIDRVSTIADSLGAPFALAYSFGVCQEFVSEVALVDDNALRAAMRMLFNEMKIAVEPACAASTAALVGPLAHTLRGRRVVLIFCGSNTDWQTYENNAFVDLSCAA
jgi:threonine dehydratase